ncbi:MAG TPA: sigma-70 family RNA polymerase sigma factor [Puia sp.]|jgi:RNA polymerase sigma-70 factor (ECF subfamily)
MAEFSHPDELLASFRLGEHRAYAAIFEKYYPRLVVFAFQIINNEAQAEEIASDSLTKLFNRAHVYETTEHFQSFLYLATRNSAINYLKYLRTFTETYKDYISHQFDEIDILNQELDAALLEKLYSSIERLPEKSRQVINYLYIQKLPYQRVAEIMQTTVKNIENIRAYALKKLREDLTQSNSPAVLLAFIAFLMNSH